MFKQVIIIISAAIIIFLVFSYITFQNETAQAPIIDDTDNEVISLGGKKLKVTVADEPLEQMQGLSGREGLSENEGMLFIFEPPQIPGFWMKDMKFSIDIIWISAEGKVVGVQKSLSPETYPKTYAPPSPIKYVLEVNSGWYDRNGIKIGDTLLLK